MKIDITELNQNIKDEVVVDLDVSFNEEQLVDSEIKNLKNALCKWWTHLTVLSNKLCEVKRNEVLLWFQSTLY